LRSSGKEVRWCSRSYWRIHGMKKVLKITSKLILSSLRWQIPGAGSIGNSVLVSFHSVANSWACEVVRVVFWFLVMEVPSMMKWLCGIWTWSLAAHRMRSMWWSKTINFMVGSRRAEVE
jgi:hypothetical protein